MKGKVFLSQNLIWVMLLLGQLHGYKSCVERERKALLELKKDMISRYGGGDRDTVLPTWANDTKSDCCKWEGISCNRTSMRVIGISLVNMYLKEYSLLNLSLLHPFEEVRSLNLSGYGYSTFHGFFDDVEGYKSLRRLRKLESLDLSSNFFNNNIFPFLNVATSLTTLYLRDNYIQGHFSARELKNLTNLELLDLSGNYLNGSVSEFIHLKNLKALDLSSTSLYSSMIWKELNLTNLEVLGLAHNYFDGPIPIEVVCEMKNLRELDLSQNYFLGDLPVCLGSMIKLKVLDLSSNQLSGNLPSSFSSLESLEYLSLSENNFTGLFSLNPLTNLTKLMVFKFSSTSVMVQVEIENTWQPKFQLSILVLRLCGLVKIPSFLVYQKNLRLVDMSNTRLSGNIPTWLLEYNPKLEVLLLRDNLFTVFQMPTIVHNLQVLDISANNIAGIFLDNIGYVLPNLVIMNGSNNGFQGKFPSSMGEMKNITLLDMSHNNFSGELPRSFVTGCFSLNILILSHNKFSGHFLPRRTSFSSVKVMRMDNNLFTGHVGVGLLSSIELSVIDMSKNGLTDAIPSWISKLSSLTYLSISNNFLKGTLPPSLLAMPYLAILDLSGNLLSGAVPPHVHGMAGKLLFLHNNIFTGRIPDTLLGSVQILDLRNNKLSGSIPKFVFTQSIMILLLSGNKLTGSIPRYLCKLSNIRLLNLSDNQLDGLIPSCLNNLSFGTKGEGMMVDYLRGVYILSVFHSEFYKSTYLVEKLKVEYYTYQEIVVKFASKQRYDSYSGRSEFTDGILGYMNGMDLSNNELSGIIPSELGDLSKLRAINLSHNFLSSSIPSSFSNLKDIESLDISHNKLHGSIPQQLTSLTSLAVLDVSYNNLSGIIPQGKQFNTFKENSYIGNPLLCGSPIDRMCEAKKSSEEADNIGEKDEDEEAAIDMLVFFYSAASTYVAALVGILVLMCLNCPWRRAWLRLVDTFIASAKHMLP